MFGPGTSTDTLPGSPRTNVVFCILSGPTYKIGASACSASRSLPGMPPEMPAAFSQAAEGSLDRADLAARIIGSDLVHFDDEIVTIRFAAPLTDVPTGYDRS
ncbi:Uncharacterized protein DBV15_06791 [Temnothorax longispinosus]|uniref:Uncharacterized protein n=1 Tax=Temnothorax longispinosus TaxID=300112 RepID=A0A4S2KZ63_9HYME|nr:Uncharacterized protein DBV15_06791 [Temnothorax longispinosus]